MKIRKYKRRLFLIAVSIQAAAVTAAAWAGKGTDACAAAAAMAGGAYSEDECYEVPEISVTYSSADALVSVSDTEDDYGRGQPLDGYTAYYNDDIEVCITILDDEAALGNDGGPGNFTLMINGSNEDLPEIKWTMSEEGLTGSFVISDEGSYVISAGYEYTVYRQSTENEDTEEIQTDEDIQEGTDNDTGQQNGDESAETESGADDGGISEDEDTGYTVEDTDNEEAGENDDDNNSGTADETLSDEEEELSEDESGQAAIVEENKDDCEEEAEETDDGVNSQEFAETDEEGIIEESEEADEDTQDTDDADEEAGDSENISGDNTAGENENADEDTSASGQEDTFSSETAAVSYESPQLILDKTQPQIEVIWDSEEPEREIYYNSSRTATVRISDMYLDTDKTSIDITGTSEGAVIGEWVLISDDDEIIYETKVQFTGDGEYRFAASCADIAGNTSGYNEAESFVIDTAAPAALITGVEDMSANNALVMPRIYVNDDNYDPSSLKITLTGYYNGETKLNGTLTETSKTAEFVFDDFEYTQDTDDLYTLSVSVCDLAGNSASEQITFSVNRFGSVYIFSDDTEFICGEDGIYYINEARDIVVTEINVDTLLFKEIICSLNGQAETLSEGEDYSVSESGDETSWKSYEYTINSSLLAGEGAYTFTIYSEDAAGNASDNGSKGKEIEFVLDYTAPDILISGAEDEEEYNEESINVIIDIYDNVSLSYADVIINGERTRYRADELENGRISLDIAQDDEYQTLKVIACDAAGNRAETESIEILVKKSSFPVIDILTGGGIKDIAEDISEFISEAALPVKAALIAAAAVCAAGAAAIILRIRFTILSH